MYDKLVSRIRFACEIIEGPTADLLTEAADAIENASKAYQMMAEAYEAEVTKQGWIPVTERLPEVKQEVLCACQAGIFEVLKYVNGINGPWYKDSRHVYMSGFVTHWMPLPEPPKED